MNEDPMFSGYDPSAAPAVVELWDRAIGARYPLREELLRQNLDRNPNFRPDDAVLARRGDRLIGFGVLQRYRGDEPLCRDWLHRAWVAAVVVAPEAQRQGVGTRIYRWLIEQARDIAPENVRPGGGIFWFFPGAPTDLPAARPFLASLGFHFGGTVYDVRADLSPFHLPEATEQLIAAQDMTVRPCEPHETDRLLDFLAAEFGAGWWYNAAQFFRAGGDASDWLLLARGDEILGMSRLHHPNQAVIGPARYWLHGPHAGGLGPIGVAGTLRGRGLGLALLHATLAHLRERGVTDAVADWTTLVDFYAKTGFAPWKAYAVGGA